jgi:hypothetical protein
MKKEDACWWDDVCALLEITIYSRYSSILVPVYIICCTVSVYSVYKTN